MRVFTIYGSVRRRVCACLVVLFVGMLRGSVRIQARVRSVFSVSLCVHT